MCSNTEINRIDAITFLFFFFVLKNTDTYYDPWEPFKNNRLLTTDNIF